MIANHFEQSRKKEQKKESNSITMEKIKVQFHDHPLISFTRFDISPCRGCRSSARYCIYGGYRCNHLGCGDVFHKECAKPLPQINHSSHPDHPLNLITLYRRPSRCSFCRDEFKVGYRCSRCDVNLDLKCATRPYPLVLPENSYVHEHSLELRHGLEFDFHGLQKKSCTVCDSPIYRRERFYRCNECEFFIHVYCVEVGPEAYHTSHPQHPLKLLNCEAPDYADKKCLLCATEFGRGRLQLHHCDVCNFSICRGCMKNPPPLSVESRTTHEHQLHLVPRRIDFTCNACGTQGDRSPYFCLLCNFMIHRECIDLPRIININRHKHRVSYTPHLGHGEWKCGVCRQKVDGFYGAYICAKCPTFAAHSRCATRKNVWDMIELEGTPEKKEIPAFEVIDENTIKHFSHGHNLQINKDGLFLHESIVCAACVFQISSESFYSCKQCDFILHEKCANLPREKRHVCHNQPFTLHTESHQGGFKCSLCSQKSTGYRYKSFGNKVLDVRCGSIVEPFVHDSHPEPLYYTKDKSKPCNGCGEPGVLKCDECDFSLDVKCAMLPQKVMRHRYDDHPLTLSYGESRVDGDYWCEACETKLNPKKWFYTCNDCGVTLHVSCVVGDFSYMIPGSYSYDGEVVSNTSIRRPVCFKCNSRCKLPLILRKSKAGGVVYVCSSKCYLGY